MSKFFSDITQMEGYKNNNSDEFFVTLQCEMPQCIGNTLLRTIMSSINTYTIDPTSIVYHKNKSCWDNEIITKQLEYIPIYKKILENKDINMIEMNLNVKNENIEYRYVYSNEIIIKNLEKNTILNTKELFYANVPLFLIGYNEEIHLTCKLEYDNKNNTNSRHQAANIGMYHDQKNNNVRLLINQQTGINSKDLIMQGLERIKSRLDELYKNIEISNTKKVYVQYNSKMRYDFILIDEDYTIGSLIEYWNNNNAKNVVTGCRKTTDNKSIIIDFGVKEYSEKNKEKEVTLIFLKMLKDIQSYIIILLEDSKKIKTKTISIPKYMEYINIFRKLVS